MAAIEILARGVFVNRGRLLVCHTRGAANTYLPGGHVEFGEGAKRAVCREILEEIGKRARVKRFLGCVEHVFRQKGRRHVEVNLVFEVDIQGLCGGRPVPSREAHLDFRWICLKDTEKSDLEPACLRPFLAGWRRRQSPAAWASSIR